MATLTISTDGQFDGQPVHDVEGISAGSQYTRLSPRYTARVRLSTDQALAIAYDLLYQAVDAGAITGWNVQFPERADG